MKPTFTIFLEDEERHFPACWEICWRCNGDGVHDHEEFNGISPDEFAEDPDFFEDYMRGAYDVPCSICKGLRVVAAPDWDRISDEDTQAIEREQELDDKYAAMQAAERRMGA